MSKVAFRPVPYVWGFTLSEDQLPILARKLASQELLDRYKDRWHTILLETMRRKNRRQTFVWYPRHPETGLPFYLWVHFVVPSWTGRFPTVTPSETEAISYLRSYGLGNFGRVGSGYARWPKGISTPEWFEAALFEIIEKQGETAVSLARRIRWDP
ncbi:hypothetical protein D9758_018094 [Tetrapyrgos nigripes]|uniref:Uncharacterized protein n=1 Tax=Tetrapyrgos nigripes TaxID=182062 RepID=A0A8H5FCA6_9AGAR|nr:hypothetical protein D9758_018094 [Tetrapyrgos nigripes]